MFTLTKLRMLNKESTKELCDKFITALNQRKHAIYPPGDKRKLPDDIPTAKTFRDVKVMISSVKMALNNMHDELDPKKRITTVVKLKPEMVKFLKLPPEFDGYYKRELLIKAINLYASLNDLNTPKGIILDDKLAEATHRQSEEVIARPKVFEMISCGIEKTEERLVVDETVTDAIYKEREDLFRVSDALEVVRHAHKQIAIIDESPMLSMLTREREEWNRIAIDAQERLDTIKMSVRLFED